MKEKTAAEGGGGGGGGGEGEVLVVGVKFDEESKALLTWTLMKVAEPGDRVIALHVLDSPSESVGGGGTSSLLSLVKTFDSLLSVYEGFCNLKQVNLKLKVCRGSSVKKVLVKEATVSGAGKVVVGTSDVHHGISFSTSVAKFCSRKLPKDVSVFAISGGKVVFKRHGSGVVDIGHKGKLNEESKSFLLKYKNENSIVCAQHAVLLGKSGAPTTELGDDNNVDNSLALVPVRASKHASTSNYNLVDGRGWSVIRQMLLPKRKQPEKPQVMKSCVSKWALKRPNRNSSSSVYPDQRQGALTVDGDHCVLGGENGALVRMGPMTERTPVSPHHGLDELHEELKGLPEKYSSSCRLFSYEELLQATSNFKPENMVGKGGSSHVYKGILPDGKELAVKILKPSENVLKEFVGEIEITTALHHKNIISLFGFCFQQNNLILVYDLLSRGSLEDILHGNKKGAVRFGWQQRCKVAVGVVEALDYLHNGCDQAVIHKDVKSSNILLSEDFEPQLSDFGLASWVSSSSLQMTSSDVTGTFGYLAPEYFMHGKVSDKVDVFAFGVVLLELISGRMPISNTHPKGHESLVMWAMPIVESGKFSQLLDPQVGDKYGHDELERMGLAAMLCIMRSPKSRPQISIILKLLQGDEEVINWARQQINNVSEDLDAFDEEAYPHNIQSHLNLALLDLDDDSSSSSSSEQVVSIEDYLKGRWSRTSSFD